jgi:hypothetical protein
MGLLVFLGCWSMGPYSVPDQQGDKTFVAVYCQNFDEGHLVLCL